MVAYADGLVQESYQRLRMDYKNTWDRCQRNMEQFLYGRSVGQVTGRFVVRKTQNACISNLSLLKYGVAKSGLSARRVKTLIMRSHSSLI